MPSYSMYLTMDHRGDCTKAKVQYSARGDTDVFYVVADPEFITPRSAFNELLAAIEEHQAVVIEERAKHDFPKDDDGDS